MELETGVSGAANIQKGSASKTMMYQAAFRYLGSLEADAAIRTHDNLGNAFLPKLHRVLVENIPTFTKKVVDITAPGLYGFSIVRSRLGDELLSSFMDKYDSLGKPYQVINLSGGFCTRFERYKDRLAKSLCTYIELDLPASQQEKLSLAKTANFSNIGDRLLPNCHFVEIDYYKETFGGKLSQLAASHIFDPQKVTLVFWEGVAMYLTEAQVDETLLCIRQNMAKGSILQFDAVDPALIENKGMIEGTGNREIYDACVKKGEPLLSGVPPSENWFISRGFAVEQVWNSRSIEERLKGMHKTWAAATIWQIRLT